jgi:Na+-transporting NADH:ubiquinone oxidoreductase subunit C
MMKTNSNSYTVIYSAVIVVIVAFLLAFVYQVLKPRQDSNVALDQKKQILYSLNIRGLDNKEAETEYNKVVKEGKVDGNDIYYCNVKGQTKYVIPMKGMGLWGGISGFIAVNADKSTVYGVYFNHESETAGLGAEIKDNLQWQEQFQGKKLFDGNNRSKIAISVQKKVTNPQTQVDAVTGATLTSNGVTNMLRDCLGKYLKFFNSKE